MNYQFQKILTPVKDFFPPKEEDLDLTDFFVHHSLIHRYTDATTAEYILLKHNVTIIRKSDNIPILRLVVECDYSVSGTLSADDEAIMDMIENSFTHLNREYHTLLNGHVLGASSIKVDVDAGVLVEEIKQHKRSGLN